MTSRGSGVQTVDKAISALPVRWPSAKRRQRRTGDYGCSGVAAAIKRGLNRSQKIRLLKSFWSLHYIYAIVHPEINNREKYCHIADEPGDRIACKARLKVKYANAVASMLRHVYTANRIRGNPDCYLSYNAQRNYFTALAARLIMRKLAKITIADS